MALLSIAVKVKGVKYGTSKVAAGRGILPSGVGEGLFQMADGTVVFLFQYGDLSTLDLDCHEILVKIEIIAIGNKRLNELFGGV